jgi:hypothetical protein
VLAALRAVPRHRFVPPDWRHLACEDIPPPTTSPGQTISQPSLVAPMTARVGARPGLRVLEVGTGSGYQAAVLTECVGPGEVDTIEINRNGQGLSTEVVSHSRFVPIPGSWPRDFRPALPRTRPPHEGQPGTAVRGLDAESRGWHTGRGIKSTGTERRRACRFACRSPDPRRGAAR